MTRFERDVVATNPDFCLVMMGANNHDCTRPQRILAEGEFETLMEQFARGLPQKTTPIGVVLNPVIDDWHFASRHPAYQELIKTYGGLNASLELERDSFRAFIRRHNWASLDLCEAFGDNPAQYILPEDGIHLNSAGHHLFAEEMFKIVAARL
jgi:lysophospholipase L1-like esterase